MMQKINKRIKHNIINTIGVAVLYIILKLLLASGAIMDYESVLVQSMIWLTLAVSLNLVCGCLGQLALGHAGFMAVGAYTGVVITNSFQNLPGYLLIPCALVVGGLIAALFGAAIGIPALRLKGDYLAILTLGFGEIIRVIFTNLSITEKGKTMNAKIRFTNFDWAFWIAVITIVLIFTYVRSRHGRAVISIRDDEIASESSGINTTFYKIFTFTLAAFFAGVAGVLYGHSFPFQPTTFDFNMSINILLFVVLGGMGSITGTVFATLFLTFIPEILRDYMSNDLRLVIYALLLVVVMILRPSGLMGRKEFYLTRTLQKIPAFFKRRAKS